MLQGAGGSVTFPVGRSAGGRGGGGSGMRGVGDLDADLRVNLGPEPTGDFGLKLKRAAAGV